MLRGSAAGAAPAPAPVNWVLPASAGANKPEPSSFRAVKDAFAVLQDLKAFLKHKQPNVVFGLK